IAADKSFPQPGTQHGKSLRVLLPNRRRRLALDADHPGVRRLKNDIDLDPATVSVAVHRRAQLPPTELAPPLTRYEAWQHGPRMRVRGTHHRWRKAEQARCQSAVERAQLRLLHLPRRQIHRP